MIEKSTSAYLWGRSLSVEILWAEKYDILEKFKIFFYSFRERLYL